MNPFFIWVIEKLLEPNGPTRGQYCKTWSRLFRTLIKLQHNSHTVLENITTSNPANKQQNYNTLLTPDYLCNI